MSELVTEILQPHNIESAAHCWVESFKEEVITKAGNYDQDFLYNYIIDELNKIYKHKLIVICKYQDKVVGMCINRDPAYHIDSESDFIDIYVDKIKKMFYIFRGIDTTKMKLGDYFLIDMLAVHPDYGQRGIGAKLVKESIKLAQSEGYKIAWCFASSPYSAKIFQRENFKVIFEVQHREYIDPFTSSRCFSTAKFPSSTVFELILDPNFYFVINNYNFTLLYIFI